MLEGLGASVASEPARATLDPAVSAGLLTDAALRAEAYIAKIYAIQGEHGDDATYRSAAALIKDFALDQATAWSILLRWNQTNCQPPWSESDLAIKFRNAATYGTHVHGAALAVTLARDHVTETRSDRSRLIASRWCELTTDLLEEAPPAKEFVWEDAIPVGDVGTFAGPGAAGKSATLVGLAVHMALGVPFLGRATRPCQTVIVSLEDNFEDYRRKLAAWKDALGNAWDAGKIAANVFVIDVRGTDVCLVQQKGRDYVRSVDAAALAEVIKCRAPRVGLIIIETVSRSGGDESNPAMSALVSAVEELSSLTKSAVVLVSHVSKASGREGNGDQYAARGGGAISDNGRFSITATLLHKDPETKALAAGMDMAVRRNVFVLRVAKINCAPANLIGLIERRPSKYQTITVAAVAAEQTSPVETRARTGAALRDLVARLGEVTPTDLGKHAGDLKIKRSDMRSAVKNAIDDGFLTPTPRKGRVGGMLLLPGNVVPLQRVGGDR